MSSTTDQETERQVTRYECDRCGSTVDAPRGLAVYHPASECVSDQRTLMRPVTMVDADGVEVDMDLISFITRSAYRLDVLEVLLRGPATPATISNQAELEPSYVSRALGELREKNVVELLVDEGTRKGRIHGLTSVGEAVVTQGAEMVNVPSLSFVGEQ